VYRVRVRHLSGQYRQPAAAWGTRLRRNSAYRFFSKAHRQVGRWTSGSAIGNTTPIRRCATTWRQNLRIPGLSDR